MQNVELVQLSASMLRLASMSTGLDQLVPLKVTARPVVSTATQKVVLGQLTASRVRDASTSAAGGPAGAVVHAGVANPHPRPRRRSHWRRWSGVEGPGAVDVGGRAPDSRLPEVAAAPSQSVACVEVVGRPIRGRRARHLAGLVVAVGAGARSALRLGWSPSVS